MKFSAQKKKQKTLDEPTINKNHTTINLTSVKVCTFLDLASNPQAIK
jgi:hypothetical protein